MSDNDWSVLHLSTGHTGGAAIAARQLNAALTRENFHSELFLLHKPGAMKGPKEFEVKRSALNSGHAKISTALNLMHGQPFFSLFSAPVKSSLLRSRMQQVDIIHIHNFYNFIDRSEMLAALHGGKGLVVTLHDERFFTAGCHLSMTCLGFSHNCKPCPRSPRLLQTFLDDLQFFRREVTEIANPPLIICPSAWIYEKFRRSPLSDSCNAVIIPNVLESSSRDELQPRFQSSRITLGFASELSNKLKGGVTSASLRDHFLKKNTGISLVTPRDYNFSMKHFWHAIDCLFLPTQMDNSPNVVIEAHLRGIPVLANDVGGVSELVFDNFDICTHLDRTPMYLIENFVRQLKSEYSFLAALKIADKCLERIDEAFKAHLNVYSSRR